MTKPTGAFATFATVPKKPVKLIFLLGVSFYHSRPRNVLKLISRALDTI
jgi:hypothetical protein